MPPTTAHARVSLKEQMSNPASHPGYMKISNDSLYANLLSSAPAPDAPSSPGSPGALLNTTTTSEGVKSSFLKSETARRRALAALEEGKVREKRYLQQQEAVDRQMHEHSRMVKERQLDKALRKEEHFRELGNSIREGDAQARSIGVYLHNHEEAREVKIKKQYDTWQEDVYNRIANDVKGELEKRSYKHIHSSKLKHYDKFLEITNAKGSVFRDIIIESEYDPLVPNRNAIKVSTGVLTDPIKRSVQRTLEERGLSKDRLHTRETLDVISWASGKIEATPHGFFAKMMAENRKPEHSKSKTQTSSVAGCLDQYNIAKGRAVLDKEFPLGKKTKHPPRTALVLS